MSEIALIFLLFGALAAAASVLEFIQVLGGWRYSQAEIAVAFVGPAFLGLVFSTAIAPRHWSGFGRLSSFVAIGALVLLRLSAGEWVNALFAVAVCCVIMFTTQTAALWWRGKDASA